MSCFDHGLRAEKSRVGGGEVWERTTLQAVVYNHDVLPPTTAIVDYAIGLEKLSANGFFPIGTEMAVSL